MRPTNTDEYHCTTQTRGLPYALLLAAALSLTGCGGSGGGGDDTAGTTTGTTVVALPEDNQDTAVTGNSTFLDENVVSGNASFNNFAVTGLQLTVAGIHAGEQVTFSGDRTFLKLTLADGELLFLGEVNRDQALDLLVDLPLGTSTVRYEIFSGSPLDDTLFGEITL